MKIDSIIFDIDGTLWNTVETCVIAWNKVLRNHKQSLLMTESSIISLMGLNHEQIKEKLFKDLDNNKSETILKEAYLNEYDLIENQGGTLFPDVYEELKKLANFYPLYLVSNCQSNYLALFIKFSKVGEFFSDSECYGNTLLPKALNINLIIKRNKLLSPVYVGDTETDFIACQKAQIPFLYANYGFGNLKLSKNSFNSFLEISNFILKQSNFDANHKRSL
jgi:phosphoglycolate phosphatase